VAGAIRNARVDPAMVVSTCCPLPVFALAANAPSTPMQANMPLKLSA
jgi:hypothetical protein